MIRSCFLMFSSTWPCIRINLMLWQAVSLLFGGAMGKSAASLLGVRMRCDASLNGISHDVETG